jgi:hypothetical protein
MWSFIGVLLVVVASFPADTSHTLQERYGQPLPDPDKYDQPGTETFRVRPGIVASARYGESGHVCDILVRPAQPFSPIQSRKNKIGSRPQVNGILIELVPVEERGRYVLGSFLILGCSGFGTDDVVCSGVEEEWDKVVIHHNGGDDSEQYAEIHWKRDECNQAPPARKK